MRHETGYLSSRPTLFFQAWHPETSVKGVVLIAHGLGGHGGQYSTPAIHWAQDGFAVYALDFRGHGRSEGPRAYIQRWQDYLQDLQHIIQHSQTEYPGIPTALWGHSLGGLIALDVACHFKETFSCLILSAPAVGKTGVSPFLLILGQILSWLWPRFSLAVGFDPRACSRNPEIVQAYTADPLRHVRGTARLSTEFQNAQTRIWNSLHELHIPTLILHGGGDRITAPQDSVRLYEALSIENRKLIQYPHAYHELHLDLNQDQVMADMSAWLQQYCVATPHEKKADSPPTTDDSQTNIG